MGGNSITVTGNVATLAGAPPIVVTLRRSAQARRLNLRVSGLDGQVTLSMPSRLALRTALEFLQEKENWLRGACARIAGPSAVVPGVALPLRGRPMRITESPDARRVTEAQDRLIVPADPAGQRTPARVAAYLKAVAQIELDQAARHYANALGRPIAAISLRDTRSRWGSCTAQGRLMFSWRLIMAPTEVLRYVAAHEVAHLRHMDHSHAFWDCVGTLMPDYATHRRWLRAHGSALHSYRFSARPEADNG